MHGADGLELLGGAAGLVQLGVERGQMRRAGGGLTLLLGTRNFHRALDHAVQQLRLLAAGRAVVDLLAHAARDDEPAFAQLAQMVRRRGRAHADHGGEIDDALLAVAQQPEDAHAAAVGQLLENIRHRLKAAGGFHRFVQLLHGLRVPVLMRQMQFLHCTFLPFPLRRAAVFARSEILFARTEESAARLLTFFLTDSIVRSSRLNKHLIVKYFLPKGRNIP